MPCPIFAYNGAPLVVVIGVHAFFHSLALTPFSQSFMISTVVYTLGKIEFLLMMKIFFKIAKLAGNELNDGHFDRCGREYYISGTG
jgi:hypothetical protein